MFKSLLLLAFAAGLFGQELEALEEKFVRVVTCTDGLLKGLEIRQFVVGSVNSSRPVEFLELMNLLDKNRVTTGLLADLCTQELSHFRLAIRSLETTEASDRLLAQAAGLAASVEKLTTMARDRKLDQLVWLQSISLLQTRVGMMDKVVGKLAKDRDKRSIELAKKMKKNDQVGMYGQRWRQVQEAMYYRTEELGSLQRLYDITRKNWLGNPDHLNEVNVRLKRIDELRPPPSDQLAVYKRAAPEREEINPYSLQK